MQQSKLNNRIYHFIVSKADFRLIPPIGIINVISTRAEEAFALASKFSENKNLQLVGFSDAEAFIEKMKLDPTPGGPAETWYKKPVEPLVEPLSEIDYNSKTTKQIEYLCKYLKSKGYKITEPTTKPPTTKKSKE